MEEIFGIMTPQNFAMLITIYLLVRVEKVIKSLEDGLESMEKQLSKATERNTRILAVILQCLNQLKSSSRNSVTENALKELIQNGNGEHKGGDVN
jgi:hypothetical protein